MNGLIRSRKFWLAVTAAVQTIVVGQLDLDPAIWQAIDALIITLIGAIAIEDAATKRNGPTSVDG